MNKTKILLLRLTGRLCCVAGVGELLYFVIRTAAGNKLDMLLVVYGLPLLCLGLLAESFCDFIEYGR